MSQLAVAATVVLVVQLQMLRATPARLEAVARSAPTLRLRVAVAVVAATVIAVLQDLAGGFSAEHQLRMEPPAKTAEELTCELLDRVRRQSAYLTRRLRALRALPRIQLTLLPLLRPAVTGQRYPAIIGSKNRVVAVAVAVRAYCQPERLQRASVGMAVMVDSLAVVAVAVAAREPCALLCRLAANPALAAPVAMDLLP